MKIITKCVVDLESMQVVEEQWFDYWGPLAQCKGGGTSGTVDFPAYMKDVHNNWLDNIGVDVLTTSINDAMESAIGNSPYTALNAYDPDTELAENAAALTTFSALLAGISDTSAWATLYTQSTLLVGAPPQMTEALIVADVDAFADQLDDEIETKVLPRFRRGMQDINAVISSAFPIGEAVIEGFRDRDVSKHASALRLAAAEINIKSTSEYGRMYIDGTQQMLQLMLQRIAWNSDLMRTTVETNRIKIVAKKEESDVNAEIDAHDALWDLEVFQHGANLLGAIGGGTSGTKKPSRASSAIGGGMSGAAAGAMIGAAVGGPAGAGVGAIVGGIAGVASGVL